MKVTLNKVDQDFHFEGVGAAGVTVNIDGSPDIGGHNMGVRPMEMMLMGLGGCMAIDVILILRKQRVELENLRIAIDATRIDAIPAIFETIHLTFFIDNNVKIEKMNKAIELSIEKYCSVSAILSKSATITFGVEMLN
jgi:putative redox protein